MIGYRTNKLYYCLAISTFVCLNVVRTDAGITEYLRRTGVMNYLREAGVVPAVSMDQMSETATNVPEMSRIFYSAIGDLVETVPIFPITFNVPDIVTGFGGFLSTIYHYMMGDSTNNKDGSEPKDIVLTLFDIVSQIAVQEDIHDLDFMT